MSKTKTLYKCSACGWNLISWRGKCPGCGEFNTVEEFVEDVGATVSSAGVKTRNVDSPVTPAQALSGVSGNNVDRFVTGIQEFDRVVGGGLVPGEVILMSGSPGAGKSTLCLMLAQSFAHSGKKVLYSSGEESVGQIGVRAKRMGVNDSNIFVSHEVRLESILGHIRDQSPDLVIVDSLQTIVSDGVSGGIGSVQQSKEASSVLTNVAKTTGVTIVLISQLVKSGDFAGSNQIAHIVDCALMLDSDKESLLKFLRASKNRFGSSTEVGIFRHASSGLVEVANPSDILLQDTDFPGTSVSFYGDGNRQIPVEVQALVAPAVGSPYPRRQFNGIQQNRGQIICAIVDKFLRCGLDAKDVFLSTVAGVRLDDPLTDLSVASAIYGATKNVAPPERTAFIGEIGLTGMVRGGFSVEQKIREAQRLGFSGIVVPKRCDIPKSTKIRVFPVEKVSELSSLFTSH